MKKVLSLFLSIVMLVSITAGIDYSAYANETGKCGENVFYSYDYATSTLTISGNGPMYDYNYYERYYSPIFYLDKKINETMDYAHIRNVVIQSGVTTIGDSMFYGLNIESVVIPDTVVRIGDCAFFWCWNALDNVEIPSSVKEIGIGAFNQCGNLNNIVLHSGIEHIGEYAFYINGYTNNEDNCENGGYYLGEYLIRVDDDFFGDFTVKQGTTLIADYVFWDSDAETSSITLCDGVKRIGNYAFSWRSENIIIPASVVEIGEDNIHFGDNITYKGTKSQWDRIIFNGEYNVQPHTLICAEGVYYNHRYEKGEVTKATTSRNGSVVTKCTYCDSTKSNITIYYPKTISLSATAYTYDGKVKTPSVTVKDSKGKTLRKNTDYTVSYASGRKNVGKYAVKITFKGNYSGSKTLYFTIKPKTTSISKITAAKKGFKVYWKKQSTQTTGYQIQYSTSSKFSNAKTVTLTKNSYTSKSISKLSAKKKYYVRVRTYKKIGSTYYYSSWSKAKYVTTKK